MLRDFIDRLFGPTPWDSSDRRSRLRTPVDFPVEVLFPTFKCIGFTTDMGPTGIRIRIPADKDPQVHRGQLVQLKYEPPRFKGIHTIECKARWLRKEGEKNFSIGLLFDDTPENLRKSWVPEVMLAALRGQNESDRKHLRVSTDIATSIQVEGHQYKGFMRDLSATGGLLETTRPLAEGSKVEITMEFTAPHPPITLDALVCRSQSTPSGANLGLTFMVSSKQKKFLQQLVKALIAVQNPHDISKKVKKKAVSPA